MTGRPYATLSLAEIKAVAKECWSEPASLRQIEQELRHRSSAAATAFLRVLTERLEVVNPLYRQNGPSQSQQKHPNSRGAHSSGPSNPINERRELLENIRLLQLELSAAMTKIDDLQQRQARAALDIHRKVGLNEDSPDFIVKAARLAYRKSLHPDARPAHEKDEAHRRFIAAEDAFNQIYKLRGIS